MYFTINAMMRILRTPVPEAMAPYRHNNWTIGFAFSQRRAIAVMVDAQHYCVKSRGVEDTGSSTITSRLGGSFKAHPEVRAEFLSLLKV